LNVTLLNSASPRFEPAKVIVAPAAASKVTVPVPASQTAASVDALVHAPETVQDSLPKAIAEAVEEIFTSPVMVTFPDVEVRSPPLIVRLPRVSVRVDFAREPPERVSALVTMMFVASVTVPAEMVRSSNVLSVESMVIVAVESNVTIPVPWAYTDPAPLVSQLPEMVHAPVVTVIVPDVPPVIVTLARVAVVAFAVRIPPFPMLSAPVLRPRSAVASSVVAEASETVRVPLQRSARVAMVNVCAVPAELVNVTLLNSASPRFPPANVIVPPVTESNITVPVPASQEAEVVAFVHVPLTVQDSLPRSINAVEVETLTVETVTFPEVEVSPDATVPLIVRVPPVSPRVPFARVVPPEVSVMVRVPPHRSPRVAMVKVCAVPALEVNVMSLNSSSERLAPAKVIVPAVAASNVTVPVPASQDAEVVEFVHVPPKSHEPLPKSMYAVVDEIFTSPSMSPLEAAVVI
jgi:hypothetical protein